MLVAMDVQCVPLGAHGLCWKQWTSSVFHWVRMPYVGSNGRPLCSIGCPCLMLVAMDVHCVPLVRMPYVGSNGRPVCSIGCACLMLVAVDVQCVPLGAYA